MGNNTFNPLISHEFPLNLNPLSYKMCDYDYALVHLYLENEQYRNYFKSAKRGGRIVYLDNSLFELGKAFSDHTYIDAINDLKPTYYVLPDVFNNATETFESSMAFLKSIGKHDSKPMAVLHAETEEEMYENYRRFNEELSKIDKNFMLAFPFGSKVFDDPKEYFLEEFKDSELEDSYKNVLTFRKAMNRALMIYEWARDGKINNEVLHHLLGNYSLGEFVFYNNDHHDESLEYVDYSFLFSVDTSHPVALALENHMYGDKTPKGHVSYKPTLKINEVFYTNTTVDMIKLDLNIDTFRSVIQGRD